MQPANSHNLHNWCDKPGFVTVGSVYTHRKNKQMQVNWISRVDLLNSAQKCHIEATPRGERRDAQPAGSNYPPISSSGNTVSVCVCACVCSQILVQMRSEKDLPSPHWFSVLEPNLWVGAPLWKAWKLGSSSSQDEWEEGAHQRAEPSGWAQIRSFFFLDTCIK